MWIATIDFTKAFGSITHKSIWNALESSGIEHDYISFLRPESICSDWRRKQHVRDQERNQTGWSSVKPAFQHGSTESIGRRHSALAKEKRYGNLPEWQRPWLPHKHEICRRRALVSIFQRTASTNVVRIQEEYWKSGTQVSTILSNQSSNTS